MNLQFLPDLSHTVLTYETLESTKGWGVLKFTYLSPETREVFTYKFS